MKQSHQAQISEDDFSGQVELADTQFMRHQSSKNRSYEYLFIVLLKDLLAAEGRFSCDFFSVQIHFGMFDPN